jgi:hypothetical protein
MVKITLKNSVCRSQKGDRAKEDSLLLGESNKLKYNLTHSGKKLQENPVNYIKNKRKFDFR